MNSKLHKAAGNLHEFLADADEESVTALQTALQNEGVDTKAFLRRLNSSRRGASRESSALARTAKQTKEELRKFLAKFKPRVGMPAAAFGRDHTTRSSQPDDRNGRTATGKAGKS